MLALKAKIFQEKKQYLLAINHYQELSDLYKAPTGEYTVEPYREIAICYVDLGDYEQACRFLPKVNQKTI